MVKNLLWKILFYDVKKLFWNPNSKKDKILEWLNSRKPLSQRIREYNKKSYI